MTAILLVKDNPGDIRLTKEAFGDANPAINLHVATDGVEAMAFLRREGTYADAPRLSDISTCETELAA